MTNSNSRSKTVRRARGHVASTLLVLLALVSLVCASALTACAGPSSDSSSSASKSASGSSSKKTLVVAMELAYPPFETKTDSGEPDGVSVQFIKDFGDAYGYDVVIQNTAWDGLIPSLQSDKADLVISSMTITDERKQSVDFSDAYAMAQLAILANADSGVASIDDLNQPGKKVADQSFIMTTAI